MSSILAKLFGGEPGGAVAGETIVPYNYDPSKRGAAKLGSGLIKPSRNMGTSAAGAFSPSTPASPANNTNMGSTIVAGNLKSPLQLGSSDVATDGKKGDIFGGLFGGKRRKNKSRKDRKNKSRKDRKNKSRKNKNKNKNKSRKNRNRK